MKTAEERVDELLSNWITDAQTITELEDRMVRLLKEQDLDTRRTCAEAVMQRWMMSEYIHGADLSAACMNVKAV